MNEHEEQQMNSKQSFTPVFSPVDVPLKHSGLGIASFIMAIVSIVSFVGITIALIVWVGNTIDFSNFLDANNNPTMTKEELLDTITPILGYLILFPFIFVLVIIGLILGIIGLARKGYKKVFAVLGTILNGFALLFVFILILIGMAMA